MSLNIGPNFAQRLPDSTRPTIQLPIGDPSDFEGSKLEHPIGIGPRPGGADDETWMHRVPSMMPELGKDLGDAIKQLPTLPHVPGDDHINIGCAPSRPFTPDIGRPILDDLIPGPDDPPATLDDLIPGPDDPPAIIDYLIDHDTPPRMIEPGGGRIGGEGIYR